MKMKDIGPCARPLGSASGHAKVNAYPRREHNFALKLQNLLSLEYEIREIR